MFSTADARYAKALNVVLNFEGGYANNPKDPGGATMHGVTQRTYDAWRHQHRLPPRAVLQIANDEVYSIYREMFWAPMRCDPMLLPISLMVFDTAVQWGIHGGVLILQEALHTTGDATTTLLRLSQPCDVRLLVNQIYNVRKSRRAQRVKENPSSLVFLLGWNRRDSKLRDLALQALGAASAK